MPARTATPCPAHCGRTRQPGRYLCRDCWYALTDTARSALNRRDSHAMTRLQELYDQLTNGVPLAEIQVSP